MNNKNSKLIKKTIWSIVFVGTIFIVAFMEVPKVNRNFSFYYFLVLLSIGVVSIFFSDIVVRPNYKTLGQKLAFHTIPILFLFVVIILKLVFDIFTIKFLYFIIFSLLSLVIFYSSMFSLNKGFIRINQMEAEVNAIRISDGIKKIRIDEIAAQVKLNSILQGDEDFKKEFQLLVNEVIYSNPTEIKETAGISDKINSNIEKLSESISQLNDAEKVNDLKLLAINTRLMIEEKNKIAQLYYKEV